MNLRTNEPSDKWTLRQLPLNPLTVHRQHQDREIPLPPCLLCLLWH